LCQVEANPGKQKNEDVPGDTAIHISKEGIHAGTVPQRGRHCKTSSVLLNAMPQLSEEIEMIIGAHSIIYSTNAEADRAFFRDVLKFTHADAGDGWLIFGLPPSELAVHPSEENDRHELFLMCDDLKAFIGELKKKKIHCDRVQDRGYGLVTQLTLPSGGKLGVYQPRHPWPIPMGVKKAK
jgi:hypothetical protein